MNGRQFRKLHGDPATWTDREYEQYGQVATPGAPVPAEVLAFLKQPPPIKTTPQPTPAPAA